MDSEFENLDAEGEAYTDVWSEVDAAEPRLDEEDVGEAEAEEAEEAETESGKMDEDDKDKRDEDDETDGIDDRDDETDETDDETDDNDADVLLIVDDVAVDCTLFLARQARMGEAVP